MDIIKKNLENLDVRTNDERIKIIENNLKVEVRFLAAEKKRKVAETLEHLNNFEEFMLILPKNLDDFVNLENGNYERKYTADQVRMIRNAGEQLKRGRLNGEILFDEWGTSGRQRPRIIHLIRALDKMELVRASNFVRDEVGLHRLNKDTKDFMSGSFDSPNVEGTMEFDLEFKVLNELHSNRAEAPAKETLEFPNIKEYSYEVIKEKTNNFNNEDYKGFNLPGRFIGSGGFAKVFLAIDLVENERFVAVKVMDKLTADRQKRFLRELEILCQLEHENILKLLGYSHEYKACLIYEYATNGSLRKRLSNARKGEELYDMKERIRNLYQISNALLYLHTEKHLIHRDIKPENILLDGRIAKLCDFGLIKHLNKDEEFNSKTANVGTATYMAPEALCYGELSFASDVYSFGLVMMESLTDMTLFDRKRDASENHLCIFVSKRIDYPEKYPEFMKSALGIQDFSKARLGAIKLALTCYRTNSMDRPKTKYVNDKLFEFLG